MIEMLPLHWAIAGGLLIGLAVALLLILSGRIAGVSGMAAVAFRIADKGPPWSQAATFTIGLPIGAWLAATFVRAPHITITSRPLLLISAGLLVGFGARLGNGCTSGHGVCGMARLSRRSIAATITFMTTGALTVLATHHLMGN